MPERGGRVRGWEIIGVLEPGPEQFCFYLMPFVVWLVGWLFVYSSSQKTSQIFFIYFFFLNKTMYVKVERYGQFVCLWNI